MENVDDAYQDTRIFAEYKYTALLEFFKHCVLVIYINFFRSYQVHYALLGNK